MTGAACREVGTRALGLALCASVPLNWAAPVRSRERQIMARVCSPCYRALLSTQPHLVRSDSALLRPNTSCCLPDFSCGVLGSSVMEPIRVLIADDYAPFRDGLRALLHAETDLELVGEAADGDEVIARARELQPDVILMDLQMPGVNGIAATHRILATSPHISVLVLTMFEDDDSVFTALQAGAR